MRIILRWRGRWRTAWFWIGGYRSADRAPEGTTEDCTFSSTNFVAYGRTSRAAEAATYGCIHC